MGSIRLGGIVFQAYSFDHPPPHIHARYAGIEVIIELGESMVHLARRRDAISPRNAKNSDVAFMIQSANVNLSRLLQMWRETHDRA